jgi:hypothetical protein
MPTTRPFAYNPTSATITGTTNVGTLCIGVSALNYSANPGGLTWWMGPDEDNSFIVAKDVPAQNFPTPLGNVGNVQFWRCANNDTEFVKLVSIISGSTQIGTDAANYWLSSNGYWSNYTSGVSFVGSFVQNSAPGTVIENAWNTFRSLLTGSYTTFTISSTNSSSVTVTDPIKVQTLAGLLRNATIGNVTIGATTWYVGTGCGTPSIGGVAVEFSNIGSCTAASTIALRPMINNANWGGIGTGSTVSQATQTITLTFS